MLGGEGFRLRRMKGGRNLARGSGKKEGRRARGKGGGDRKPPPKGKMEGADLQMSKAQKAAAEFPLATATPTARVATEKEMIFISTVRTDGVPWSPSLPSPHQQPTGWRQKGTKSQVLLISSICRFSSLPAPLRRPLGSIPDCQTPTHTYHE